MTASVVGCLAFAITLVVSTQATVDPLNTTYFHPIPGNSITFNITHKQWRGYMSHGNKEIPFWVNPYQLPEKLMIFRSDSWETTTDVTTIYDMVVLNVMRTIREWGLTPKRVLFQDYYAALAKHSSFNDHQPLIPLNRFKSRNQFDEFPLEIHFRYPPYQQSSFGEFVTNRQVAWRVWDDMNDYKYSGYVGATDDLVYRLRHNLGHSMGLGHTKSTSCIMYPTNIRDLRNFCREEKIAMKALLFGKIRELRYGTETPSRPVKQYLMRTFNGDYRYYTRAGHGGVYVVYSAPSNDHSPGFYTENHEYRRYGVLYEKP